jgi:hypothetical protein
VQALVQEQPEPFPEPFPEPLYALPLVQAAEHLPLLLPLEAVQWSAQ